MRPRPQAARSQVAEQLVQWYNQHVAVSHVAVCPPGAGPTDAYPRYHACRGAVSRPGRMSVVAWSKTMTGRMRAGTSWPRCGRYSTALVCSARWHCRAIQVHDVALCRPLLETRPGVARGRSAARRSRLSRWRNVIPLKRQRQVDVIMPLKANMLATQEAIQLAEMADTVGSASLQGRSAHCPGARCGAYVARV